MPLESFDDAVDRISAQDRGVFDSHGYEQVRDLVWSRADTVIWLSYPRAVVRSRVLRRSFGRACLGEEIFNGNTETFRDWLDPEHPVQWAWTQYAARREDLESRFADPAYAHLRRVRLCGPFAARRWLDVVLPATD